MSCICRIYRGVDEVLETLRNLGIEFVLATLKELHLATLNVLLPFVCTMHCSCQYIFVLDNSTCERIGKWETCPILKDDRSLARVLLAHLLQKLPHY
jgi:hypothetical protein